MKTLLKILFSLTLTTPILASSVLFLGDSQSIGPFGAEFDRLLRLEKHTVSSYASGGSVPQTWFNMSKAYGLMIRNVDGNSRYIPEGATPSIRKLLKVHNPKIVVLQFGGNYTDEQDDKRIVNGVKKIIKTIKDTGAQCYWINNPDKRYHREGLARVWNLMEQAVGSDCPIFRSQDVTEYPDVDNNGDGKLDGDGRHYTFAAGIPIAKNWANLAAEDFKKKFNN